ncbi:MAG: NAD-dependent epimerase/dehydratase family protein [bacterium]|nr:NAD-dependent epimerase/dehydratase family protein [bacterium]
MDNGQVEKLSSCRICKNKRIRTVLSLGSTPLANSFLRKEQLHLPEPFFPLELNFCSKCGQLQLGHVVSPDLLFKNYVYVSSTSPVFVSHFEEYAKDAVQRFKLGKNSFVVDIGSNDGILLKPFKKLGTKVLGIDPATAIAQKATREGIETLSCYFTPELAEKITKTHGPASIITANNVFAHVNDLDNLINGIKILLGDTGVFIIEVPYLVDFLEKNLFDTIYHEHLSYFSLKPLTVFFQRHGMKVFDTQRVSSHGGSIRVFTKRQGANYKVQARVKKLLKEEQDRGLHSAKTYIGFSDKIKENRIKLTRILGKLKAQGKTIVGYGAPAKGNTLLNYFGIGKDILDYIVDDSPLKQGLYTPGTHIPVVPAEALKRTKPDYILILAWNFAGPIMEKLSEFGKEGGGFILPAPKPTIIRAKEFTAQNVIAEDLSRIIEGLGKDVKKLEGKTILISGGSGFLGSYINATIHQLNKGFLRKKCHVISIDNYITGSEKKNFLLDINDKNFEFISQDIRLPILIRGDVDYIIHAAGLASPYYYQKYPLETIESAVVGAKNLLELARMKKAKSFLFFSSSEIYGDPDPKFVPTPETYAGHVSSVGPRACYDESKRLGETLCLVYHQQYQVPVKIVRPFNVYGPGMKPTDYRVVPTFLYRGLTGKDLPVHGEGRQTRTFCYVTDAIIAFLKVLLSGKEGEIYNVGNGKPEITMYELATTVAKILNNGVKVKTINYPSSYPAGEPQRRCPDLRKIKSELGYKPSVDLEAGLARTIAWYRSRYNL